MRRTGYAQLHRGIIGPVLGVLTGNQTKVLVAVIMQASPTTHRCELTLGEIAAEAGIERRKVTQYLRHLEHRGLIEYFPGRNQHAKTMVNVEPAIGVREVVADLAALVREKEQADDEALLRKRAQAEPSASTLERTTKVRKKGQARVQARRPEQPEADPKTPEPYEPISTKTASGASAASVEAAAPDEEYERSRAAMKSLDWSFAAGQADA